MATTGWATRISGRLLPMENPRVLCPPARPAHNGRSNVVVATPMRSGTHLLIDLLLNNLPAYRTRPLYVNLDRCISLSTQDRDRVKEIASDAGQIVKTHLPVVGSPRAALDNPEVHRVLETAVVVTVRRDRDAVLRSLKRWGWGDSAEDLRRFEDEFDAFWGYWDGRQTVALEFDALLDAGSASAALEHIADLTGTTVSQRLVSPIDSSHRRRIYLNKGLTRVLGRHAPRIDTTIHTLKR